MFTMPTSKIIHLYLEFNLLIYNIKVFSTETLVKKLTLVNDCNSSYFVEWIYSVYITWCCIVYLPISSLLAIVCK